MRHIHQQPAQRISPSRTFAIATAVCVHVSALLLILSPARPEAQAQNRAVSAMEVIEVSPPIPPPPPPPPEIPIVRPPQAPAPVVPRPIAPPPPIPLDVVCADCSLADPESMRPEPMDSSTEQTTTGIDSFSDAHADAAYGSLHHVRYPSSAIRRREQGEVQLRLLISTHGEVLQSEVLRSSGSTILDRSAREAVLDWRFVAAEKNGNAIEAWVIVPIRFNLGSI